MGSYATLTIGDFPIASTKNDVDPTILMLFDDQDKRLFQFEDEDADPFLSAKYVASLRVIRDRLDHMGFTSKTVETHFREGLTEHIGDLTNQLEWYKGALACNRDNAEAEIQFLSGISLNDWLAAFKYIIRHRLQSDRAFGRYGEDAVKGNHPPLACYLLGKDWAEGIWFPSHDFRVFMRAAVDITGVDADVTYDLTDLIAGECADPNEEFCAWARQQLLDDAVRDHKTIVLTEGNSDGWAIHRTLKLFYPHLEKYFSFMDFDGVRAAGGAGVLVATIKAFIGAGIVNRTIAFFDNDTAAMVALRGLRDVRIPDNLCVLQYGELQIAKNYPTLGPQGVTTMDVNGMAGSLELYFGEDVLRDSGGTLAMIQWRGFDDVVGQYQGELRNKSELQARFDVKLTTCERDATMIEKLDWSGMLLILDQLRTAFH